MMGKFKRGVSVFLTLVAGILAIVAAILYRSVPYRFQPVYIMLIGVAAVAALHWLLAGFMPRIASYLPVCMAAALASAAVWGTMLMVNQLGYVYAGLDPLSSIMTWIYFVGFTVIGMLLCIVAAFMRAKLETR
ncbi:MAG: hypothetical protein ACSW8J_00035 [bacterium]